MNTIKISREKQYRSRFYQGPGPEWWWTYYLPEREVKMTDGRVVKVKAGGYKSKAETVTLARKTYMERPIRLQFPDGSTTDIKR